MQAKATPEEPKGDTPLERANMWLRGVEGESNDALCVSLPGEIVDSVCIPLFSHFLAVSEFLALLRSARHFSAFLCLLCTTWTAFLHLVWLPAPFPCFG